MDGASTANVGPGSPLDRLPDDILLRILAAGTRQFAYNVDEFGDLKKLCRLRTVCHRFDDLAVNTQNILWTLTPDNVLSPSAHRFLQQCQKLRTIRLVGSQTFSAANAEAFNIPNSFWLAISGVTPNLEKFELIGVYKGFRTAAHEAFKTMAMCPHLVSMKLESCVPYLTRPLSSRYKLKSLIDLSLSNVEMSDRSLSSILEVCEQLESLALSMVAGLTSPAVASSTLKELVIGQRGSFMTTLKVVAPNLSSLTASGLTTLAISAPKLEQLFLRHTCAIVLECAWKVTTLEVGPGTRDLDQLKSILTLCEDARVLKLPSSFRPDVTQGQVALSKLLICLRHLECLELPLDIARRIDSSLENAESLSSILRHLTTLKVCFEKIHDQSDLCLELCRVAPRLEILSIDLTKLLGEERADVVAMRLLEIQRRYPKVKVVVNWPNQLQ